MANRRSRTGNHRTQRVRHHPRADKAGLQPGTLVYVGDAPTQESLATLIEFGPQANDLSSHPLSPTDCNLPTPRPDHTVWVNVHGLSNTDFIKTIGRHFGLHPLVMEDILNTGQRAKVEVYQGYLFITARLVHADDNADIESEQIAIVLGQNWVLTFQERPTGSFKGIREALQNEQSQLRRWGADYLVYSMLDKLVDRYFTVLEAIGERIEAVEDSFEAGIGPDHLGEIQNLRRSLLAVKRGLWPLREMINTLQRDEPDFFRNETQLYLRDVYDHTVQLIESVEALRDLVGSLQDTYLSLQSHRMNLQMRVLTVITTIFLPLSLLAGIYGMNFENIPELHTHNGYFVLLGVMVLIAASLAGYFKYKRWF